MMTDAQLTVHEQIVDLLAGLGATSTFGLMGEDTASLIADLDRRHIAYYHGRHENVAIGMADGYAWATGKVGVAIISRGPGLTNGLTALTTAARAKRGVLVLTAASSPGRVSDLKIIDQPAMCAAVGVHYRGVDDAAEVVDALSDSWAAAERGQTTVLAFRQDLLDAPAVLAGSALGAEHPAPAGSAELADLQEVADLLDRCSRPLILVGRGGGTDSAVYEALAHRAGGILGTTFLANGLFGDHPLNVGVVGGFSAMSVRGVLAEVDCVLAFGASLNGFTLGHGRLLPSARIVQFDDDPSAFARYGPPDIAVLGDALASAHSLLHLLGEGAAEDAPQHAEAVLATIAHRDVFGPDDASDETGIDARVLVQHLDGLLPTERQVITDGGHHLGFGASGMYMREPGRIRLSADFAAVGMGLGAAFGAAVARPDLVTILFIGDGGQVMTLGDLTTISRYGLRVVVVVMNDRAYGAELHFMDLEGVPHEHSLFEDVDFAGVAAAVGFQSATIRTVDDLQNARSTLGTITAPVLLDCKINPTVRAQWLVDLDAARRPVSASAATAD